MQSKCIIVLNPIMILTAVNYAANINCCILRHALITFIFRLIIIKKNVPFKLRKMYVGNKCYYKNVFSLRFKPSNQIYVKQVKINFFFKRTKKL